MTISIKHSPFPCHKTIKGDTSFDDPAFEKMESCAGAAIFLSNQMCQPMDAQTREHMAKLKSLPNYAELAAGVFQWPREFVNYHEGAKVRSWEF